MLEQLKLYLGISGSDRDDLLNQILSDTSDRLKNLLGGVGEVPYALQYIVLGVSTARFNQIGSEGASAHSVDGESMTWSEDLFAPYMDDINTYLEANEADLGRGVIRFL